jgi:hypothetical protein
MRTLRLLVVLVLTALTSAEAGAQSQANSASMLRPGARVRLTLSAEDARRTGHDLVKGTLVTADPLRFVVTPREQPGADTVATFTIDRVEVYAGQRRRSTMVMAGAAAGGTASLLLAGLNALSLQQRCKHRPGCKALYPTKVYILPIAVGTIFGSTFSSARWVTVPRPTLELGADVRRSIVVGSTISFR